MACEGSSPTRDGAFPARLMRRKVKESAGQMTVELAVALPVMIIIAVIAVNAMTFFSICAQFDRVSRDAIRICAASPAPGWDVDRIASEIDLLIEETMHLDAADVEVLGEKDAWGHARFTARLRYRPTLFGMGMAERVFGVELPRLEHASSLTVDAYKPGMLF